MTTQAHRISIFVKDGKVVGIFDDIDHGGSIPQHVRVETTPVATAIAECALELVKDQGNMSFQRIADVCNEHMTSLMDSEMKLVEPYNDAWEFMMGADA